MKIKDCACIKTPYRRTSSLVGEARQPASPNFFWSRMMRGPSKDWNHYLAIGCVHPAEVSGGVADHKNKRTPFVSRRDVEARGSMMTHEHESEFRDSPFLAISRLSDPIIFVKPWLGVKAELRNFLPSFYLHCIVNDGMQLRNTAHQDTLPRINAVIWKISSYNLVGREITWRSIRWMRRKNI